MRDSVDYKKKYMDLRAKMVSSMDMAFRMGYEKGSSDAAQQQMQQQLQQQMQQMQTMAQGQQQQSPEQQEVDGQNQSQMVQGNSEEVAPPDQTIPQESAFGESEEVDQYINELETLVNKGELSVDDLKKSIEKIKTFKIRKSTKLSPRVSANLSANDKRSLSTQEIIIDEIMKKWETETSKTADQAMRFLGTEALTKKE